MDRNAARCANCAIVATRIVVPAARSAAGETGNQPRGAAGISRGGVPWLVRSVVAIALLLLGVAPAHAQSAATASIGGTVRDTGGGVLPGVTVTASHTETGQARAAVTGPDGAYRSRRSLSAHIDSNSRYQAFEPMHRRESCCRSTRTRP